MELVKPSLAHLESYAAALRAGWSPDNVRGRSAAIEQRVAIEANPAAFLAGLWDLEGLGPPVRLPDGSLAERLPGYVLWIWDGAFCGSIGFRWRPGTSALPEHVLGHVGYAVVPWKQRRGYATRALAELLPRCRAQGLDHIDLTTTPDNLPSQRVILANGGKLVGRFAKPAAYGGEEGLLYRIRL
ncbi:MAG: GNAT family N-acetyltransferase [Caulobacteraceae bacterium]|nr:GNAT family N-acetyltransferase [Caulobacteraceae bacterium]